MFLTYGLDAAGNLVRIDHVPSGKTSLLCPYCKNTLIARHGKILAPHFAHAGATCRPASGDTTPMATLDFNLFRQSLTGPQARDLNELRHLGWVFRSPGKVKSAMMTRLEILGFVGSTVSAMRRHPIYWTTLRAEAFFLRLHPATWLKFAVDETRRAAARAEDDAVTRRLLEAELALWQSTALYLLRIKRIPGLYKIGITSRSIEERVVEVQADLRAAGQPDTVEVLRHKPGCGAVEPYLKALWQRSQAKNIGSHQEYFWHRDDDAVVKELDLIEWPPLRPAPEQGRQVWRALFAGAENIRDEWSGMWHNHLRFVAVRDRHGNSFGDTVLFRAGKNFDAIDLNVGDLVEFTATPDDDGRLLRPAKIKVVASIPF
ncbi:MAG: hypothetical protein Kow0031_33700 [Anaerolineae bacterium]